MRKLMIVSLMVFGMTAGVASAGPTIESDAGKSPVSITSTTPPRAALRAMYHAYLKRQIHKTIAAELRESFAGIATDVPAAAIGAL